MIKVLLNHDKRQVLVELDELWDTKDSEKFELNVETAARAVARMLRQLHSMPEPRPAVLRSILRDAETSKTKH